jgi:hypothetical protein
MKGTKLKKQIQVDVEMNFQTCDKIDSHGRVLKLMVCICDTQITQKQKQDELLVKPFH